MPSAHFQTDSEGKLRLFVAIDRTSKLAFVELHREGGKMIAARFGRSLVAAVPYAIHTVLTDNPVLSDRRRQAVEGASTASVTRTGSSTA